MDILGINALLIALAGVLAIIVLLKIKSNNANYPPCYGWLPYIGCAIEFGKAPLEFIEKATRQVIN